MLSTRESYAKSEILANFLFLHFFYFSLVFLPDFLLNLNLHYHDKFPEQQQKLFGGDGRVLVAGHTEKLLEDNRSSQLFIYDWFSQLLHKLFARVNLF